MLGLVALALPASAQRVAPQAALDTPISPPTRPPLRPRRATPSHGLLAALAAALLVGRSASPAVAAGGGGAPSRNPSTAPTRAPAWIGLKSEFRRPGADRALRAMSALNAAGLSDGAARKFFVLSGGTRRERVMGLHGKRDRMSTLRQAQELVRSNGGQRRAFYIDIEVHNLGGMNEVAPGSNGNAHLKAFAQLVGHELDGLDAHAVMFRQGGPRFSAVVYAGATVAPDAVATAMRKAQAAIDAYAQHHGLTAAKYPKNPMDQGAGGAGIAFGVAAIEAQDTVSLRSVVVRAETRRGQNALEQRRARERLAAGETSGAPATDLVARFERLLLEPSRAIGGGPERRWPQENISKRVSEAAASGTFRADRRFPSQIALRREAVLALAYESLPQLEARERGAAPKPPAAQLRAALLDAFRIAGGENRDQVTGLGTGEDRIPTLARARAHVGTHRGDQAFYVVVDIGNVGGMNLAHGKGKVNREVFRRFAAILRQQLGGISGVPRLSVSGFRHGGDELSFVVVGTGLTQGAVAQAMAQAQAEVREAATRAGLMNTPHLKGSRPPGTGIYFHVAPIPGNSDIPRLLDAADHELEAIKHAAHGPQATAVHARPVRAAA